MSDTIEVLIEGRLVNGHPMTRRQVKKKLPGAQVETVVMEADGVTPVTELYFAVAVPKTGETDWKLTPWGQQINSKAMAEWPGGEHAALTFSWKIIDGDSIIPNKKGKKPCDREGWSGHWIVNCSTRLNVRCHHAGKLDPTQQIAVEAEIKTGDYCRALLGVKGNGPSESPGVYVNPILFELSRAGVAIINDSGPSAADAFGGSTANVPANAQVDTAVGGPKVPGSGPSVPNTEFVDGAGKGPSIPAIKYLVDGAPYTAAELKAFGPEWTDAVIATLAKA